ncbi:hypothetical protein MTO96_043958 [Rhipicephalus appendiculatus]
MESEEDSLFEARGYRLPRLVVVACRVELANVIVLTLRSFHAYEHNTDHIGEGSRCLVEGDLVLEAGHVIECSAVAATCRSGGPVHIIAYVLQSSGLHNDPHKVELKLQGEDTIQDIKCTCPAGYTAWCDLPPLEGETTGDPEKVHKAAGAPVCEAGAPRAAGQEQLPSYIETPVVPPKLPVETIEELEAAEENVFLSAELLRVMCFLLEVKQQERLHQRRIIRLLKHQSASPEQFVSLAGAASTPPTPNAAVPPKHPAGTI